MLRAETLMVAIWLAAVPPALAEPTKEQLEAHAATIRQFGVHCPTAVSSEVVAEAADGVTIRIICASVEGRFKLAVRAIVSEAFKPRISAWDDPIPKPERDDGNFVLKRLKRN